MAHPLRIQRKRTKGYRLPAGAVCVHRPTKWGNPFRVMDGDNGDAVRRYDVWLHQDPKGMAIADSARRELPGKLLACFCPLSKRCHADVLAELVNGEEK